MWLLHDLVCSRHLELLLKDLSFMSPAALISVSSWCRWRGWWNAIYGQGGSVISLLLFLPLLEGLIAPEHGLFICGSCSIQYQNSTQQDWFSALEEMFKIKFHIISGYTNDWTNSLYFSNMLLRIVAYTVEYWALLVSLSHNFVILLLSTAKALQHGNSTSVCRVPFSRRSAKEHLN